MSWRGTPSHGPDKWPPEALEALCRMWDGGKSAREIGAALGRSRAAVLGRIHRLRGAGHPFSRLIVEAADKPGRRRVLSEAAKKGRAPTGPPRAPRPFSASPIVVDAVNARPWTERVFGQCAYPISGEGADTFSCCSPTNGLTYCAAHREVMYASPRPAKPRPHAVRAA